MSDQPGMHLTRPFLAGALGFTVLCGSASARETIEALFADLPEPGPGVGIRELRLDEVDRDGIRMLEFSGFGEFDPGPLQADMAQDILVSRVSRLSLDADPDRLHLHAAAVATAGRGVVISASGGTGKSTLALALLLRGWDYVTDEMVALAPDFTTIAGIPKPLVVKVTGRHLFDGLEARRVAFGASDGTWWHLPASVLGARSIAEVRPELLVFLSRATAGASADAPYWTPIHPADAVVMLVQQSMDVGRYGESALELIGDLVSRCRSVQVEVGTPSDTAALVEQLLAEDSASERAAMNAFRSGAEFGYATGVTIGRSVVSVSLGGRVVVHDVETGKIASFDEAGSAVWLAMYGQAPAGHALPAPDSPGVRSFFHSLANEGFIVLTGNGAVGAGRA